MERAQVKKIMDAIDSFEKAVRADEIKGGGPPEDMPTITKEYEIAKTILAQTIGYVCGSIDKGCGIR